ncbi:MAG TPA: hypothetical protein VG122_06260 [Gemmata sp.]|nr:hypothetical protein [Gemmata sp.]
MSLVSCTSETTGLFVQHIGIGAWFKIGFLLRVVGNETFALTRGDRGGEGECLFDATFLTVPSTC